MHDKEKVEAMTALNWKPSTQYWREKFDEAQAEIERLRAEVDEAEQRGYAKAMEAERILYDQSLKIAMRDIHNDAIEAATELLSQSWDEAIQCDLEHGVKSLNERAHFIFKRDYPEISRMNDTVEAIRALKRPPQEKAK